MTGMSGLIKLVGRAPTGHTLTWEVKVDTALEHPGSGLRSHRVRTADGLVYVQRTPRGATTDRARALLDNEIRALARLTHAFPDDPVPFPRLVGYDMDSADPWALVAEYRGKPARAVVGGLLDRTAFTAGLFDAVAHATAVGVSLERLDLDALYVEGTAVQVVVFEHSALFDEPRPDRRGFVSGQQDVLDAGKVLYEVYTGTRAQSDRPDLAGLSALRPLADVFHREGERPDPRDVVERLGQSARRPAVPQSILDGRAAFDLAHARKQPVEQPPPPPEPPAPPDNRTARVVIAVSLAVFAIAVAVLLILIGGK
ncbi:hypothetical protein [Actinokineospora enzanensis]|uniref:hypothetical protein n=1 Tax=Actinokineospora enzanensis TaxID=155975 RepID=UPI0003744D3F|nr:hypothetical protein [Actinokineospora enzanensis]